jgi:hypothetical protein
MFQKFSIFTDWPCVKIIPVGVIGQGKFLSLVKAPSGWEYCTRNLANDQKFRDESIAVTPVYKQGADDYRVILELNKRPPLDEKSKGLNWEIPAGITTDADATVQNSILAVGERELLEETGRNVKKFVGKTLSHLSSSAGLTDETGSIATAICSRKPKQTIEPDQVALALVSVPLKQAFQFLRRQSEKGMNVSSTALAGILKAFYDLKIQPDLKTDTAPEAKVIWRADQAQLVSSLT